ncbi:J domain-containing protein CG6693-like [Drosophila pseudoobscura]|uniref:J domain-containing protein CG6693-like n=1 Tax=Drosophila pseudoobscura pseudoobscura TaxID=46245 RepID=A0A6I8V4U4_DROPS|nr:J domain-containing protein CG6693 [Drosophila pseudoobscura]
MSVCGDSWLMFGTRDFYKVLDVSRGAMPRAIRSAAYQLIMAEHPGQRPAKQRRKALQKCHLVYRIMSILTNDKQRALYDSPSEFPPESASCELDLAFATALDLCACLLGNRQDRSGVCELFQKHYKGSQLELADIKAAYTLGKGCMDRLFIELPLMTVRDEPRIRKIIKKLIKSNELPEYSKFINESVEKRRRRRLKFAVYEAKSKTEKNEDGLPQI